MPLLSRILKLTLIFILFSNVLLFAQTSLNDSSSVNTKTFSRLKISGGFIYGELTDEDETNEFANLNYRITMIKKIDDPVQAGIAIEIGVNYLEGFFPLYIKAGPEVKIFNQLFVSWNAGLIGIFFVGHPAPFWGINSYYLFNLTENTYLEAEFGLHNPLYWDYTPLYYINFGISFN